MNSPLAWTARTNSPEDMLAYPGIGGPCNTPCWQRKMKEEEVEEEEEEEEEEERRRRRSETYYHRLVFKT